jgi:dynactin complex subunit
MKYEDQVEKLKMENMALSDTVQRNAQDLLRMEEQVSHLNLELTISQEEHRTCQIEVSSTRSLQGEISYHTSVSLFICKGRYHITYLYHLWSARGDIILAERPGPPPRMT